ncbi:MULTISPECIES: bacillithiol biosynthesis cysteine-adding enzyme BshC [unclassified Staphylococcus]|uniref:bacillithiol biosynthesis cysteine-adding enzyme BshC n=1 Tax=unclassified Staphylococcus TaxID=91994 RepID=UPI0021D16E8A|nr:MULTISPECIES: bacillithiol biosynthesis cysteine-adding enzyme BshC [unclassified Staphylococcus]UXR70310.1 bacillithiol biosynthesis cysteine-adding enzyme BshC [Staphylococcus sp. IVB6246]UXR72376.1 bacillithiol biosynthesis cysteine-adding enzyme BshC [Staphylococcus sp. IVB6240]UXR74681.1 bacillithiol biosynthesis cysteine-adding enzyme BshC [Staphylococcus sp. IVB6238]UXR77013.1 bacillithiol biosynthesis cysteine-adding enzyme BshC [Staphylococcus sp. IVB6233]UXR81138.1 bacillithiol bi
MDCLNITIKENDSFIKEYTNHNADILQFFTYDPNKDESYKQRMAYKSNGREKEVANVVREYMSDLTLTQAQLENIAALSEGAKVVVGGQQAGLFTGPLYTFHKILSIVTKADELSTEYKEPVVPVFWIAGEDHDFDEVNHTYVMNQRIGQLKKVKYHTMTPPETTVSRYAPDREALHDTLVQFFESMPETVYSKQLFDEIDRMIQQSESWVDVFKQMIQLCFGERGILLIDAQDTALRNLEMPLLKEIIQRHEEVDQAFRNAQSQTTEAGLTAMIQTDTNVHLFLHEEDQRQLLSYVDGEFKLSKSDKTYSREALLSLVDEAPERFSNNVVTRPLMEEWLFNTVAFIGGPSEIKYWAELKGVFELFDVQMPIVLPRMRMTYLTSNTEKLLKKYDLTLEEVMETGTQSARDRFIRANASEVVLEQIEKMHETQQAFYETVTAEMSDTEDNKNLVKKNQEIQMYQLEYLKSRYLNNIARENEISMRHFEVLTQTLHPMGGLQERVWNPLQILNENGLNVYASTTFPPLPYTFDQIIIKL